MDVCRRTIRLQIGKRIEKAVSKKTESAADKNQTQKAEAMIQRLPIPPILQNYIMYK